MDGERREACVIGVCMMQTPPVIYIKGQSLHHDVVIYILASVWLKKHAVVDKSIKIYYKRYHNVKMKERGTVEKGFQNAQL